MTISNSPSNAGAEKAMTIPDRISFTRPLLAWFRSQKRDLPWRRARSAYRTWISEVMLQQTVVAAVAPRFERWMRRFPDATALAKATERAVLREWEGLGYYARARNLHRAAQRIVELHGGNVPGTRDELRALPGIGDYTAAAILSLAFGRPEPVLDANVRRVMTRVLCVAEWNPAEERRARASLAGLIAKRAAGAFNEAMMELGALICRPGIPNCAECPVAACCEARRRGLEALLPRRRTARSEKKITSLAVMTDDDRVCIRKRGKTEIGSGLWGFPVLGGRPPAGARRLPSVTHAYTIYRDELRPWLIRSPARTFRSRDEKWVRWNEIGRYPFPSVYRKIIAAARQALGDNKV